VRTEKNIRLYLQNIDTYKQNIILDLHTVTRTVTSNQILTILDNTRITSSPELLDRLWANTTATQIVRWQSNIFWG